MARPLGMALFFVAAFALGLGLQVGAPHRFINKDDYTELDAKGDAERGKEIFYAGGCAACHATPNQGDHLKLGGGLALHSPFGTFYAPNISPDKEDGIGSWSAGDLANAMIAGVSPRFEHYYPAFPYTTYTHASLDDIADLMAFIRTLPPISGKAASHELNFPFTMRRGLGLWKFLFFSPYARITVDSQQDAAWNRGNYLVNALGHCAECHSPRNSLGAIIADRRFSGGPNLEGKGTVPDITQSKTGLAQWSQSDIADFLKTGITPDGDSSGGSMHPVILNMQQLSDEDRNAIATYIKSLPPIEGAKTNKP